MKTNIIFSEFNLKIFFSMHEEETSRMRAEKLLPSPSALHRGPDLTNSCKTLTPKHAAPAAPFGPTRLLPCIEMKRVPRSPQCWGPWLLNNEAIQRGARGVSEEEFGRGLSRAEPWAAHAPQTLNAFLRWGRMCFLTDVPSSWTWQGTLYCTKLYDLLVTRSGNMLRQHMCLKISTCLNTLLSRAQRSSICVFLCREEAI